MVAVFRHGPAPHRNNVQLGKWGRNRTNVWSYPGASSFLRSSEDADLLVQHATPKPVKMVADALLDVTARGDLVLDGFLGTGATLMACERIGRRCRAIELDPLYVDLTIRRWQRMTGENAVRKADGRTFDELAAETEAVK
jgi:DNA modification methylase